MKEDYLWDKTGSDAEIEKLETALRIFRCEETAPPVIPAKVLPFVKKESPRRNFPFLRAVAACLALTSISLGAWILVSNTKKEIAGNVLQKSVIEPEIANPIKPATETEPSAKPKEEVKPTFRKTLYIEPKSSPKSLLVSKSGSKNARHNSTNRKIKNTEKTIRLTEEEKYAFEQLMLALSITSSKLKLVKDKVEGIEEPNAVLETDDKIIRRK